MTLRNRLVKLEGTRGGNDPDGPTVIFLLPTPIDGQMVAILQGGQTLLQAGGEAEAAFTLRARAAAGDVQAAQEHVLATLARKHDGGGNEA